MLKHGLTNSTMKPLGPQQMYAIYNNDNHIIILPQSNNSINLEFIYSVLTVIQVTEDVKEVTHQLLMIMFNKLVVKKLKLIILTKVLMETVDSKLLKFMLRSLHGLMYIKLMT
jgi:hypothetical protein